MTRSAALTPAFEFATPIADREEDQHPAAPQKTLAVCHGFGLRERVAVKLLKPVPTTHAYEQNT